MWKIYFTLVTFFVFVIGKAQVITFPDAELKAKLIGINSGNSGNYSAKNAAGEPITIDANFNQEIEVDEALDVAELYIDNNSSPGPITDLTGINYFTNLKILDCNYQQITNLDVTGLSNLEELYCISGQVANLAISGLPELKKVQCYGNSISSLDVSGLPNLELLYCNGNQLATLDITQATHLKDVNCSGNTMSALNVAGLGSLETLGCYNNSLTALGLSGLGNLLHLDCSSNAIASLDFSGSNNLHELSCYSNNLTSIDVSNLAQLDQMNINYNSVSQLDVSGLSQLSALYCEYCSLSSLNVSGCYNLSQLYCDNNSLTTLDTSDNHNQLYLNCSYNNLVSLFIKNGATTTWYIFFGNNDNLQYVCVDEEEAVSIIWNVSTSMGFSNPQNIAINSYCTFVPGGTLNLIKGSQKFDADANGCDANDIPFPNLNFSITDGTLSSTIISDTSGNYSIPVYEATHTISPNFENPNYFTASPESFTVTFPDQPSPAEQDFCITANGSHEDAEITLLPIIPARPGFDATYKLVYKNKGSVPLSGSVEFNFQDDRIDFVSSAPAVSSQEENLLSWDYSDLQPLESREIDVTLNINSTLESPAVNINDQLSLSARVYPLETDEMAVDNLSGLKQIVVSSYDPNDKTCVEGTVIDPSQVGEYVHYIIRFENTGNYAAQNIVVKDIIDISKFDITTLVPISSSHHFVTRVSDTNKVEFIFENINLPFDDNSNDGYVAFKIKTLPGLASGDDFSNTASIFFDYNLPVETNIMDTAIETLGNSDFDFSNQFTLYPNPAKNSINLESKSGASIKSVSIYNALGQIVLAIPNTASKNTIDVSSLKPGSYLIKINSDKGITNTKFVKI